MVGVLYTGVQLVLSIVCGIFAAACIFVAIIDVLDEYNESTLFRKFKTAVVLAVLLFIALLLAPMDSVCVASALAVAILILASLAIVDRLTIKTL